MIANTKDRKIKSEKLLRENAAFPVKYTLHDGEMVWHGLSKREWFAGMALIALAGKIKLNDEIIARYSVDVADAVIAELDKKKEEK